MLTKTRVTLEDSRIKFALQGKDPPDPEATVRRAVQWFGDKLVVSCSFGRCSVAVLHMALKFNPRIRVVFNETGVEYPETYEYKRMLTKLWKLNLVETKPLKSYWQCVKEYGLPQIRGSKLMRKIDPTRDKFQQPHCCYFLKERPMINYCRTQNISSGLTGMRAAESRNRVFAVMYYGNCYYSKKWEQWRIHPIAYWKQEQVCAYLEQNQIPVNPIYAKLSRSGCMPCTAFRSWEQQLSMMNPKMYAHIQHLKGVNLIPDFFQPEEPCLRPVEE